MPPGRSVYILQSQTASHRYDTGVTADLPARLREHNAGRCHYTASARPWKVIVTINFTDEQQALRFERYLKLGSRSAFSRRHFR